MWRPGRYLALEWWQVHNLPFVDGRLDFLAEHWGIAVAAGPAIFIAALAAVRHALARPRTSGEGARTRA